MTAALIRLRVSALRSAWERRLSLALGTSSRLLIFASRALFTQPRSCCDPH